MNLAKPEITIGSPRERRIAREIAHRLRSSTCEMYSAEHHAICREVRADVEAEEAAGVAA